MTLLTRIFVVVGALNAALVIILGAYAAHALRGQLSTMQAVTFQTAIQYHMFHSLGLIVAGAVAASRPKSALLAWAGALMLAGIVLFCGSLYVGVITGYRGLGVLAPFGGTAFIVSWLFLALAVVRG